MRSEYLTQLWRGAWIKIPIAKQLLCCYSRGSTVTSQWLYVMYKSMQETALGQVRLLFSCQLVLIQNSNIRKELHCLYWSRGDHPCLCYKLKLPSIGYEKANEHSLICLSAFREWLIAVRSLTWCFGGHIISDCVYFVYVASVKYGSIGHLYGVVKKKRLAIVVLWPGTLFPLLFFEWMWFYTCWAHGHFVR